MILCVWILCLQLYYSTQSANTLLARCKVISKEFILQRGCDVSCNCVCVCLRVCMHMLTLWFSVVKMFHLSAASSLDVPSYGWESHCYICVCVCVCVCVHCHTVVLCCQDVSSFGSLQSRCSILRLGESLLYLCVCVCVFVCPSSMLVSWK